MRPPSHEQEVDTSVRNSPGRDLFLQAGAKNAGDGSISNDLKAMLLKDWASMPAEGRLYWEDKAMLVGSLIQADDDPGSPSSAGASSDFESESE